MNEHAQEPEIRITVDAAEVNRQNEYDKLTTHLGSDIDIFRATLGENGSELVRAELTMPASQPIILGIESEREGHLSISQPTASGSEQLVTVTLENGQLTVQKGEEEPITEFDDLEKVRWASFMFSTMQSLFIRKSAEMNRAQES